MKVLPIMAKEAQIINAVNNNQVVIVVGPTGSGKTTEVPIMLLKAGLAKTGMIGVTEPRRLAATSVARYVAEKRLKGRVGDLVGYQVRFDKEVSSRLGVKFMTDGILLRELQSDPDLKKYSCIMIDEAHERSTNIDFCLGLLKDLLKRRPDFKVIVASATIDAQKFSDYFGGAPIVEAEGRTFPVEIKYLPKSKHIPWDDREFFQLIAKKIINIHQNEAPGDILTFVAGVDEINYITNILEEANQQNLIILPAHGSLSPEEQNQIFEEFPGQRKVVLATNIAETSLTIDGVVHVVDSGYVKQMNFHPENGISSLDRVEHSQAGCDQRAGRAGRTRAGVCHRMFHENTFRDRPRFTEPEIRRSSIAGVVLMMEDIGIENIQEFDFIDSPDQETFREAYNLLRILGAIEKGKRGLTDMGKEMAQLPLEPTLARIILEAERYDCVIDVATVAAFMSARNVFVRPKGKEGDADLAHAKFKNPQSDALTWLHIWNDYVDSGYDGKWCYENSLNAKALREITSIRQQLLEVLDKIGLNLNKTEDEEDILKALTAGLLYNLYQSGGMNTWHALYRPNGFPVYIHPGSSLFNGNPGQFLIATEIVKTSKAFARGCTSVKWEWLFELVPDEFTAKNPHIVSYDSISDTAIVEQDFYFREVKVATLPTEVDGDKARTLQQKMILEAEGNGLKQLTFTRKEEGQFSFDSYLLNDTNQYRTWGHETVPVEMNQAYYCEVENFTRKNYARPKFMIFNLTKVEKDAVTGEVVLDLGSFASNLNARFGKSAKQ